MKDYLIKTLWSIVFASFAVIIACMILVVKTQGEMFFVNAGIKASFVLAASSVILYFVEE